MVVQGFGVRAQSRRRFRGGPKRGRYEGRQWVLFSEGDGVFQWRLGPLTEFSGPTIAHALRAMRKAARTLARLERDHGEVSEEALRVLALLMRWEQRALRGRLKIEGPLGKGESRHHRVREV